MKRRSTIAALIVTAVALCIVVFDPGQYLNLEYLRTQQRGLEALVAAHPVRASLIAFAVYTGATALSIPGAIVMTLAAGAVFGLLWGMIIVSFASTVGATIAFLMSRYLFHGFVQARFGHRLRLINRGMRNDGPIYLLTLRLIPVIPYVAINVLLALTSIRLRDFYLYSQIGMLPATLVYVNAGTQLADIDSLRDIISPDVLAALGLLAAFPLLAKVLIAALRGWRLRQTWPRPAAVDRNVIVIGAGSAGLVASLVASAVKARVTLIEASRMGGDCLNTGCVPSKAFLRIAHQVHAARHAGQLGLEDTEIPVSFAGVMARVREVIATIEPHDSEARYRAMGVECIRGHARLRSPYEVEVNGQRLSTRAIIIATGARPFVPDLPGIDSIRYLTSDSVWSLSECPERLLVLGGGPIGCELAQGFARLGSRVTVVEMAPRLLPREGEAVSELLAHVFNDEGIALRLHFRALAFRPATDDSPAALEIESQALGDASREFIEFDEVIIALGRRANVDGLGLESLGIGVNENGTIEVNDQLQTRFPNILACGDVAGPHQFTHAASYQASLASVNALFANPLKRFAADYRAMPWCTFTDPQVARVGLSEAEASEQRINYELTVFNLSDLDRAIADGETRGFVRVLTARGSDRILGVTVMGAHAGDTIAEFVLAMKHNLGLKRILDAVHIYPTFAEANRLAAGQWRRAHASPGMLSWLERFHRWRREGRKQAT